MTIDLLDEAVEFVRRNRSEEADDDDGETVRQSPSERLRAAKALHDDGVIDDEEFEAKKEELMDEL